MNFKSLDFTQVWNLVKQSVTAWIDDYAPSMGAALAYYTVFSIAPLLIIVTAVAGFVFGREAVQGEIAAQLGGLLGEEAAVGVQGLVASASEPKQGLIATVISIVVLVVGATTVFSELQSSLDRIWRVPAPAKASGIWNLLRTRIVSFGMVLGLGFLLLVSLVFSAALAAFGSWWGGAFKGWEHLLQLINFAISLVLETGLFAMIYKFMPRAKVAWDDVWIGAGVTALLFEIGKLLIGLYLGKSGVTSGFGAAMTAREVAREPTAIAPANRTGDLAGHGNFIEQNPVKGPMTIGLVAGAVLRYLAVLKTRTYLKTVSGAS